MKTRKAYDPRTGRTFTMDGDIFAAADGGPVDVATEERMRRTFATRARAAEGRRERDSVMRDLGLVKVRGPVSGRTYWE